MNSSDSFPLSFPPFRSSGRAPPHTPSLDPPTPPPLFPSKLDGLLLSIPPDITCLQSNPSPACPRGRPCFFFMKVLFLSQRSDPALPRNRAFDRVLLFFHLTFEAIDPPPRHHNPTRTGLSPPRKSGAAAILRRSALFFFVSTIFCRQRRQVRPRSYYRLCSRFNFFSRSPPRLGDIFCIFDLNRYLCSSSLGTKYARAKSPDAAGFKTALETCHVSKTYGSFFSTDHLLRPFHVEGLTFAGYCASFSNFTCTDSDALWCFSDFLPRQ